MGLFSLSDLEYMFWAAIRNGSVGTIGAKGDPGGITLGTIISTEDLNTIKTAGVYRRTSTSAGLLPLNYPNDTDTGVLVVHVRVTDQTIVQEFHSFTWAEGGKRGYFRRTFSTATWSAWQFIGSVRIDNTAGRAIYQWDHSNNRDQLVYGDTGQRDITALKDVNVSTGTAWIRRNGQLVTLNIHAFQLTAGGTGTIFTGTIPTGFTPANLSRTPLITASTFEARLVEVAGSNVTLYNPTNTAAYSGSITYVTNDAWPTVLPGSAVGTIPNL